MSIEVEPMGREKRIALIAHDGKKDDLLEWVKHNKQLLSQHKLYGTGSTGKLIHKETRLDITLFMSGPLGGDQQIGAKIAEGEIDMLVFFWDPLQPQPHDPDVKALLRIAVLHNIPTASNRSTADFIMTSELMSKPYERQMKDYSKLIKQDAQ